MQRFYCLWLGEIRQTFDLENRPDGSENSRYHPRNLP
jgi:hypothetical protein